MTLDQGISALKDVLCGAIGRQNLAVCINHDDPERQMMDGGSSR